MENLTRLTALAYCAAARGHERQRRRQRRRQRQNDAPALQQAPGSMVASGGIGDDSPPTSDWPSTPTGRALIIMLLCRCGSRDPQPTRTGVDAELKWLYELNL
ncbi:jg27069 [Pararge aegeria aegeria]|uniref:Jg27069 protein n=1 Tax=Pararge aegeria aegeria TaxID=348720 RepID=A0A8S4S734_9NEOP|nr:jg27069 [Pararge aegeria aegeria]